VEFDSVQRDSVRRVGWVGVGKMGGPMAARVAAAGYPVTVFDVDDGAVASWRHTVQGTVAVSRSLSALAASSDVVAVTVPDGAAVRAVVDAPAPADSLLAGASRGLIILDMGSSLPAETCALAEIAAEKGVNLLDAPVSGGVAGASAGTLCVMAGGSAELLALCDGLFRAVASSVFSCGPIGSGHAMKALNNVVSAAGLFAVAEAVAIGTRLGLDESLMIDVLNASTGRNFSTETKYGRYVLSQTYDSGFGLPMMLKDVSNALTLAHVANGPSEVASLVLDIAKRAHEDLGPVDHTKIVSWLKGEVAEPIVVPLS
jgi:3-hydroxyisobutyrate dehydrogenase